jgi:hypothetical protein
MVKPIFAASAQRLGEGLKRNPGRDFEGVGFCAAVDATAFLRKLVALSAPVAQLDRASDYGSEGLKFESSRVRHFDRAALAWV